MNEASRPNRTNARSKVTRYYSKIHKVWEKLNLIHTHWLTDESNCVSWLSIKKENFNWKGGKFWFQRFCLTITHTTTLCRTSWQGHVVEQISSPHGVQEKGERRRGPWPIYLLRAYPQWPSFLVQCPTF
jgi:hypothetical protein